MNGENDVTIDHIKSLRKKPNKREKDNNDPDHSFSFKVMPMSEAFINKLSDELPIWVLNNPDARFLTEFITFKGMTWDSYQKLVQKYPRLKAAHDSAKRMMGERMFCRAMDNKANWQAVKHRLYSYAPEFREDEEYHAQMKAKEKGDMSVPQERYIVIPSNVVRVIDEGDKSE